MVRQTADAAEGEVGEEDHRIREDNTDRYRDEHTHEPMSGSDRAMAVKGSSERVIRR